jgi:hypothetical protein
MASIASAVLAGVMREHPLSRHFTLWDDAAWSLSLGLALWLSQRALGT